MIIFFLGHSNSNISSEFVHFCKAIASRGWWAHRKHFTELHIASPAYPPCGRRAYGTIPHCFKRHPTWLIMILGIRAHSIRFQLTVQIDKGSTYFYVLSIQGTQLLLRNAQTANWYLNLNVLGYRYKKKFMCIRSTQKSMRIYNYTWTKFHFHARAVDMSSIFWFSRFCLLHISISFYKMILMKICWRKNYKEKFWKYGIFSIFWKWLKFKTWARQVKTKNNKNPRDTILYYVLFYSFDNISHHVTHYPGSLSPPHVRIS